VIAVATSLLAMCSALRFIPSSNDKISGQPRYMRIIADGLARTVAGATGNESPVILIQDEALDCQWTDTPTAGDPAAFYYVILYSETYRAFCFVTYAEAFVGGSPAISRTLTPKTGRNYGHPLTGTVTVVPVAHVALRFPEAYLARLHWRAKADPEQIASLPAAEFARSQSLSFPHNDMNLSLNFDELRVAVGHKHEIVNTVLDSLCVIFLLLVLASVVRMEFLYVRFRDECRAYHPAPSLASFLRRDLEVIIKHAHEERQRQNQEAMEALRAANLLDRSREAVRKRLGDLLDVLDDDAQRRRVQESLAAADLQNMRNVLQELESHVGQKTPEERLTLLLESLKEFCTAEEFEVNRLEAFDTLARIGFRKARLFVVQTHDEFRARAKSLEDNVRGADSSLLT
jgi:hypothetical protein